MQGAMPGMQTSLLDKVEKFISLEKGDESRGEVVDGLRTDMNSWVAKYRRRGSISGRASFGCGPALNFSSQIRVKRSCIAGDTVLSKSHQFELGAASAPTWAAQHE